MNVGAEGVRRPLALIDWVFVLGLPISEAEFVRSKAYSDFTPSIGTYREYEEDLVRCFEDYIAPLEQLGLKIVRYASQRDYARVLRKGFASVLFTHCNGRGLELRDGLVPFSELLARVDPKFRGIAEVCACEADGLQALMKQRAENAIIRVNSEQLSVKFWMTYYSLFLLAFHPGPKNYAHAVPETASLLARTEPGDACRTDSLRGAGKAMR